MADPSEPHQDEMSLRLACDPVAFDTDEDALIISTVRCKSPIEDVDHSQDLKARREHSIAARASDPDQNVQKQYPAYARVSETRTDSSANHRLGWRQAAGAKVAPREILTGKRNPIAQDSGYESSGRVNTLQLTGGPRSRGIADQPSMTPAHVRSHEHNQKHLLSGVDPYARSNEMTATPMMKQPISSPISPDQLATEVKGIYSGLVMVEAKCINIDAAQAAEPKSQLTKDQWQALIALHRTLLYEHHDFLMATQHPTATEALKGLAIKYSMPARMWKHGIHAFLEVLRHRRPESQEYMLAFIYLAYQMMALLFETVPSFTDTWIECLGDLARYRMAIEEDKEIHAAWGGVAARWYTMASDRNPSIGRLYHHLGILERPSLRKLSFYVKSLTCTVPFTNARDSLATLCGPIVQDDKTIESSTQSPEARIVTFWALVCCNKPQAMIEKIGNDALRLLHEQLCRLREFGSNLAITCIAALFERGHPLNPLWQLYSGSTGQRQNQKLTPLKPELETTLLSADSFYAQMPDSLSFSATFCYKAFNMILIAWQDEGPKADHLQFAHVMLVWQHSLHEMRVEKDDVSLLPDAFLPLVEAGRVAWDGLAAFLNSLSHYHPVSALTLAHGRAGTFPRSDSSKTLPEDYIIRGLVWAQKYFPQNHFIGQSEDDGRAIETQATRNARADRVQWLGLYMAFHAGYLTFDEKTRLFAVSELDIATIQASPASKKAQSLPPASETVTLASYLAPSELAFSTVGATTIAQSISCKRSSSSRSNSDEGFHVIKYPRTDGAPLPALRATRPPPTMAVKAEPPRKADYPLEGLAGHHIDIVDADTDLG